MKLDLTNLSQDIRVISKSYARIIKTKRVVVPRDEYVSDLMRLRSIAESPFDEGSYKLALAEVKKQFVTKYGEWGGWW